VAEKKAQLKANEELMQKEKVAREEREAKMKAEAEAREKAAKEAAASSSKPEPVKPVIANLLAPTLPSTTKPEPVAVASSTTIQSSSSPLLIWDQVQAEHDAYIKLHGDLKRMRKHMTDMYKRAQQTKKATGRADPPIDDMSDMRRQLQKSLGQLTLDTQKNKKVVS
jgi:hypothetical protein